MPKEIARLLVGNLRLIGHAYGTERARGRESYDAFRTGLWNTLGKSDFEKCDAFFRTPKGVPHLNEMIGAVEQFYSVNRAVFAAEQRDFERRHGHGKETMYLPRPIAMMTDIISDLRDPYNEEREYRKPDKAFRAAIRSVLADDKLAEMERYLDGKDQFASSVADVTSRTIDALEDGYKQWKIFQTYLEESRDEN